MSGARRNTPCDMGRAPGANMARMTEPAITEMVAARCSTCAFVIVRPNVGVEPTQAAHHPLPDGTTAPPLGVATMNTTTQPGPLAVRLSDQLGPLVERLLKYSDIRRNDPRENREALRDLIVGELADELRAVQAAERERCIKACAAEQLREQPETEGDLAYFHAVNDCIAAIRRA
jgi:hypothetical protein